MNIQNYIIEINFLRAISIIFVILFHLDPIYFPAGYLGVDIFFVISGFVITQSIYNRIYVTNNFSIFDFYTRRIKRLAPALFFMVFASILIYFFFGYWRNSDITIISSFASLFGVSNLFF